MRNDADAALDYTSEALALGEFAHDTFTIARAWSDLGRIYFDLLEDYDAALAAYQRSLAINPSDSRVLNNLGNLARAEGDFRNAIAYYKRSGAAAKKAKDRYGEISAEHNIGLVYTQQNDPAAALLHLRRALAMDRSARTLLSISEAERALGNDAAALRDLRRARAASKDDLTLATILLREGDLRLDRHDLAGAARAFDQSIRLAPTPAALTYRARLRLAQKRYADAASIAIDAANRANDPDTIAHAQSIAGQAYRALHNRDAAKRAFSAAIDAIERERRQVAGGAESRERSFEAKVYPYLAMVDLLAESNDARGALEYAERAKGRVLVDVLQGRISVPAFRLQLPEEGDAILEYAVSDSALYAFVVTREGVREFTTVIPRAELAAVCNRFASELASRNLAFRRTARHLWDLLLEPEAPLLRGKKRICIVPDSELWRVPFQALIDPSDRYVADDAAIFYAPSIAAIRPGVRQALSLSPLIVAMPEARSEAEQIAAIYAPRAHVEIDAREQLVKDAAPRYDILHFATHGVFDDDAPLSSYLVFGRGRLEAREMMSMHLNAQLVVLSACQTAMGRPAPGEGIIGMSWALFVAGCPTMVASEWKVEATSTSAMMVAFHRNVAQRGMSPAEALRAAQLDVRRHYEHPFYWASFVVLGRGW
ncbi:MAG TPA: CHAT domain-containing protein [Thermoanaerobaculia bacterium]|nr:CHAT domain-containing protein [Thermoanaerobaculia bacterium]